MNLVSGFPISDSVLLVDDGDGGCIFNCSFDNVTSHKVCCRLGTPGEGSIHELLVRGCTFIRCVGGGVIDRCLL